MEGFEIRFSGAGGQGLQLCAGIFSQALLSDGWKVSFSQSYEPTSRGGLSRSDLVVSRETADYPLATSLDYLLILDQAAADVSNDLINSDTLMIYDPRRVTEPPKGSQRSVALPLSETAIGLGSERVTNVVACAALAEAGGMVELSIIEAALRDVSPPKFLNLNIKALMAGAGLVQSSEEAEKRGAA